MNNGGGCVGVVLAWFTSSLVVAPRGGWRGSGQVGRSETKQEEEEAGREGGREGREPECLSTAQ